jgi:hypothetical protein
MIGRKCGMFSLFKRLSAQRLQSLPKVIQGVRDELELKCSPIVAPVAMAWYTINDHKRLRTASEVKSRHGQKSLVMKVGRKVELCVKL